MLPGELKPGALIGEKYRLERLIGRGGMGAVFLATHAELGRKVAVKVLDLSIENDSEAYERFKREGKASAAIGHPGVVEVLDTGTTQWGMPYLVMEYLEGPTLRQFSKLRGPLDSGMAAAVAVPILDALSAAHRAGVIHRDLKPANVLLSIQPRREVKLLDFGISKFLRSVTVITRTGVALGTPAYMSPEQMEGEKELTPAADLYSLGVILFQLLAGRLPFVAENDLMLMRMVVMTQAPPLQSVKADAHPRLSKLVDRLLTRDPRNRPGDPAEVRRAVLEAVQPTTDLLWWQVEQVAEPATTPFHEAASAPLRPTAPELPARPTTPEVPARPTTPEVPARPATPDRLERPTTPAAWPAEAGGAHDSGSSTESALPALATTQSLSGPRRGGLSPRVVGGWALAAVVVAIVMYLAGSAQEPAGSNAERSRDAARSAQARKAREATSAQAQSALAAGDLEKANRLLNACTVGAVPCPEGAAPREQLRAEKQFKVSIDLAERALVAGNLATARQLLAESRATEVFRARWMELEARARDRTPAQAPEAGPTTAPVEVQPRDPAAAKSSAASALTEEAREHSKRLEYDAAKTKLLKCLRLAPDNATCHKLLGSIYANLKDPKKGVFHYKKYLELAPDDPAAPRVKGIIDAYESSQR